MYSVESLRGIINAFNNNCIPRVPEKGTVGASGDLAPLAHLALGMIGEGKMYEPDSENFTDSASVLKKQGVEPIILKEKEGLALINGTQFMTALGAEALVRAENLAKSADVIAAMTIEALFGLNE